MTQEYEFKQGRRPVGTNTSSSSASTLQPSGRVIRNILNYARCTQCICAKEQKIRLFLN